MADAVPPPTEPIGSCRTPNACDRYGCHGSCDAASRFAAYEADSDRMTAARERAYGSPWWMKPISAFALAFCTLLAAAASVAACVFFRWAMGFALVMVIGGCAVGYPLREDGTANTNDAIIGISTGTANAAGAGLLSLGGLLSGNPAIVGLAALVANQVGKRQGWTEYEEDTLKKRGVVATTEKSI